MRDPYLYIEDILNSIEKIKRYTVGMAFRDFIRDEKTIDAVLRNLEVIGEAAKNIPKEIQQKYPQIPWKEIAGMRDRLIHAYFGVDLEIVWHTITSDLPKLESELSKIIKREG
ncbi:HepT-like ribonuclease domain-containing protein [Thermococcus alcaliphilus]|uniref:HepT-like ribonuclease domain-containing protein n=1 Tax=Thermococcus alcaliphilus TaxID=139207 RepID=UPI002091542D|nr:DUF86 domain-containing protein [Thermococcus alcaliphilus]MCO6040332.1 DUF86 domain-containing protein [Thermococcus alcaliphilus]